MVNKKNRDFRPIRLISKTIQDVAIDATEDEYELLSDISLSSSTISTDFE